MQYTNVYATGEPMVIIDPRELMIGSILINGEDLVEVTTLSLDYDDESEEQVCFCKLGESGSEFGGYNRALTKISPVELTDSVFACCGSSSNSLDFLREILRESFKVVKEVKTLPELQMLYFVVTKKLLIVDHRRLKIVSQSESLHFVKNLYSKYPWPVVTGTSIGKYP